MFGVFHLKNHDFTPKNHIFSNFRGGGACAGCAPPLDPPLHFSQLFCLQVRSVTTSQLHDKKSRCLRGRRHSSILYSPSGLFPSYFINEVNF